MAVWPSKRPSWFPTEFDWVVGCSYTGLAGDGRTRAQPHRGGHVLPPGAFRATRLVRHRHGPARGPAPRVRGDRIRDPDSIEASRGAELVHVPGAKVRHHVEPERVRVGYFLRRCYSEGISKAAVTRRAGAGPALSTERRYVLSALPRGVLGGLDDGIHGDFGGFAAPR